MNKCMIVAEMSANHNGSKQLAIETIKAAKRAGADAINRISLSMKVQYGTEDPFMNYIRRLILLGNGMKNFFKSHTKRG